MAFELHDMDITKQFLKDTLKQLQGVPDPTICFLCNGKNKTGKIYCPYAEECHAEMKKFDTIAVENTQALIDKRLLHDL